MTTRTVSIRIKTNKNGKRVAHYWGLARRWLPISVQRAELALALGEYLGSKAVRAETSSDPLPAGYIHTSVDGDIWASR